MGDLWVTYGRPMGDLWATYGIDSTKQAYSQGEEKKFAQSKKEPYLCHRLKKHREERVLEYDGKGKTGRNEGENGAR